VNVVIVSFHVVFVIIRKLWTCGKVIGNHRFIVLCFNETRLGRMVKMKIEVNCLKVAITQEYGNKFMKANY
jgi:hypothetical protein